MDTKTKIEEILCRAFGANAVKVMDDSAAHQGHAEQLASGGGHFTVIIISEKFQGLTPLKRHRMVNDLLMKGALKGAIHALSVKARTPDEH